MVHKIPLVAVIGSPVAHSKSPMLHGHWLKSYEIAGFYIPIDVSPENFYEVVQTLPKMGFVGANVTIPHKEVALKFASNATARARKVGAANTLIFDQDGGYSADNTDGVGFVNNIKEHIPTWSVKQGTTVVLGAGGAARGILAAVLEEGSEDIILLNRTRSRAEDLAQEFGPSVRVKDWEEIPSALQQAATVVNTTSLGMVGNPELDIDLTPLSRDAVVTDIVYTPLRTGLLKAAEDRGCRTVDGFGMLLHQAVPGFERWFGIRPQVTAELRELLLS